MPRVLTTRIRTGSKLRLLHLLCTTFFFALTQPYSVFLLDVSCHPMWRRLHGNDTLYEEVEEVEGGVLVERVRSALESVERTEDGICGIYEPKTYRRDIPLDFVSFSGASEQLTTSLGGKGTWTLPVDHELNTCFE